MGTIRLTWLLILSSVLLAASSVAEGQTELSQQQLQQDLQVFGEQLVQRHKNAFARISQSQWQSQIDSLSQQLESMDRNAFAAKLNRLASSIGDGHTSVAYDFSTMKFLPINFKALDDGIFVRAIDQKHKQLVQAKLVSVGGLASDQLLDKLAKVIPHDNHAGLLKTIDKQLNSLALLQEMGAAVNQDQVELELQTATGERHRVTITAVPLAQVRQVQWTVASNCRSYSMQKPNLTHWNDWLPQHKLLYFRSVRCQDAAALKQLVNGTAGFVKQNDVQKFVVDLRDNAGGDSTVLGPLVRYIAGQESLNRKGKLFVLVNRDTFSSAVLNAIELKTKTNTILVGEPPSGRPNHFGEIKSFDLPQSGLKVWYSTKYFTHYPDGDPETLPLDVEVKLTSENWFAENDPVIQAVIDR